GMVCVLLLTGIRITVTVPYKTVIMNDWIFRPDDRQDSIEYREGGDVTIRSVTGKLCPFDPDRFSFYYTKIPSHLNFRLSARMVVDHWLYTNGQEGMGLAALDRIAGDGDASFFWNNLLTVGAGKVKCRLKDKSGKAKGAGAVYMLEGICAREKTGLTQDTLRYFTGNTQGEELWDLYDTKSYPLIEPELIHDPSEEQGGKKGFPVKINLIGNRSGEGVPSVDRPLTTFMLSLEKTDKGYILSYTDEEGNTSEHFCNLPLVLEQLDPSSVYAGVFAARSVTVTFRDITLTTCERGAVSKIRVSGKEQNLKEKKAPKSSIREIDTAFMGLKEIYASPDGSPTNSGASPDAPVNLQKAVAGVYPGQVIRLLGGNYIMKEGLTIPSQISGREGCPIVMTSHGKDRPVIDFAGTGTGLILFGSYWQLSGLDIKGSADGCTGLRCCGSHNRLTDIYTYGNGNTGLQVSAKGTRVPRSEWPSDVLIEKCVSFNNADSGLCDADGFAAKITCGEGVVFRDCLAFHNADDGFDLYAKCEAGPIGDVVLENCIAYGNKNGFKLGGSYVKSDHSLIGCLSMRNRVYGITNNHSVNGSIISCIATENGRNLNLYGIEKDDYRVKDFVSYIADEDDIAPPLSEENFIWKNGRSINGKGQSLAPDR
ncbi:MAG: hypothetical protein IJ873_08680, partial [Lachnospiraceae bacterium]|nr:hypothetical protein [Lachnospiraceae bacterium]